MKFFFTKFFSSRFSRKRPRNLLEIGCFFGKKCRIVRCIYLSAIFAKISSVKQQKLALKTNFQILMKKITSFSRKYIEIFFYEIFQKNFTSFFHEIACKNCFLTNFLFSFHIPILRKFWCEICIACEMINFVRQWTPFTKRTVHNENFLGF